MPRHPSALRCAGRPPRRRPATARSPSQPPSAAVVQRAGAPRVAPQRPCSAIRRATAPRPGPRRPAPAAGGSSRRPGRRRGARRRPATLSPSPMTRRTAEEGDARPRVWMYANGGRARDADARCRWKLAPSSSCWEWRRRLPASSPCSSGATTSPLYERGKRRGADPPWSLSLDRTTDSLKI